MVEGDAASGERHTRRAAAALIRLGESDPAFATLSLWCRHRDRDAPPEGRFGDRGDAHDPSLAPPPAWTDGRAIYYGPRFEALDPDEQMGAAAHQILHIAFRHAQRARALSIRLGDRFDEDLFGLAADAIVNETLLLAGRPPPRPCPLLSELLNDALSLARPGAQALAEWDAERLYGALTRERPPDYGRTPSRRSDPDGVAAKARAYAAKRGGAGDLVLSEEAGCGDDEGAEDGEWRQRLARALETGRLAGEGLGVVGRRLADLPEPRTPWETLLRGMAAKAILKGPRLDWRRPTRRWIAREAAARAEGAPIPGYEPGLRWECDTPVVAMGIDASASVSDALLHRFAAEVCGVGRRTGAAIHLLVFDVAVRGHVALKPGLWEQEISAIDFSRGGGTSFVAVLEAAARLDPSIIVLLTDLDGPMGPRPGRTPVIWATPEGRAWVTPPFGTVISLDR